MDTPGLAAGARVAGFEVLSVKELAEFEALAVRCRHPATGCELFHLWNEDPENLFAFAFRTPPPDDSGVSHIVEHSVLCGSRLFPLKDPFVILLKSSLSTFLNAFTFPDKTVYPASSMLEKDFFNLLLVYGDAVFFPLLKEEVFLQEAHHLEFEEGPQRALQRVGVVYNEMKGVFSSPESVVADQSLRSLFPDVPYGYESGGHPRHIPSLTYESFAQYHRRYYHPANCRIFLYGNIPTARTLEFLQEKLLGAFGQALPPAAIASQVRWGEPRFVEATFPVGSSESVAKRSSVTLNWLTVPVTDPLYLLSMEVLSEILVGNVGSPLHKALLESGLGDDLSPATGLETEVNELIFTVGLRGTEPAKVPQIETLVMRTLEGLAAGGAPEEQVRAAIHRVEFRNREILRGGKPFSLTLLRRSLRGWLHGCEPERTLEFRPWMDALKERLARGGYLEEMIRRHFLENRHRSTVLVRPDPQQAGREEQEYRQEMQLLEQSLSVAERERIELACRRLKAFQEQPDSPQDLARVPALHLEDLPKEVERIPTSFDFESLHQPSYFHDLHTNGIVYVDLALDVSGLPEELSYLLPLFSRAVCGCGLPGIPYHQMAGQLSLLTGGFGAALSADTPALLGSGVRQCLIFRVKMLEENLEPALGLVARLATQADFRDTKRLETLVLEQRNDLKASLVPAGSHYVSLRAGSRLSEALLLEERWKGISQLQKLSQLGADLRRRLDELAAGLEQLREAIVARDRLTLNLTFARAFADRARPVLEVFLNGLPAAAKVARAAGEPPARLAQPRTEALVTSTNVNFAAVAVPASAFGTPENAHESVLAHFLSTGFLWEQVRMKGGAYGAGAAASGLEKVFTLSSYRDPNISQTLKAFQEALLSARQARLPEDQFEQVLIGAVGREEKPLAPGEKGFVALKRTLLGITDELRQARREQMMRCAREDLAAAASRILDAYDRSFSAVLSSRPALQKAARELEELASSVVEIPD